MPGFALHVAPRLERQSIGTQKGMDKVYQFVADISIHCCGERVDLSDRAVQEDATDSRCDG